MHSRGLYFVLIGLTWVFNTVVSALVGNLPAPTKDSSAKYIYWFKVANSVIGNIKRAQSTALEQSPNFEEAVRVQVEKLKRLQDAGQ